MMPGHKIDNPETALAFMLAGKAVVTLKSEATGEHLTFQLKRWKKATDASIHFVSARTGNDYGKIGMVRNGTSYIFGKAEKNDLPFDDKRVRGFRYAFEHLCQKRMPPKCEVWHEGQCGRCGRPLSDPDSIARGIGPECIKKMGP